MKNIYFLILLLLTSLISAEIPNPFLLNLPDGQWSQIPNSSIVDDVGDMQIEGCYDSYCDLNGIFDYSGAVFDHLHNRFILFGGGHYGYYGNQIYTFEQDSLIWKLWYQPTSIYSFIDPPTYMFNDGKPVSRHTYDQMDYIDHLDVFFQYSGATAEWYGYHNGTSFGDLWTFDFKTVTWTDYTTEITGDDDYYLKQPGYSGEYDPVTEKFYYMANGVWSYDFSTKHWDQLLEEGAPGIERSSILDTKRRKIFTYGGDYGGGATLSEYDINNNTFTILSSSSTPGVRSGAGLAYDEANDLLVMFGGQDPESKVWYYDYDAQEWSSYSYSGGPSAKTRNYCRFAYDRVHNVFMYIHRDKTEDVWVWKNTLGSPILIPSGKNQDSSPAFTIITGQLPAGKIFIKSRSPIIENSDCNLSLYNVQGRCIYNKTYASVELIKGVWLSSRTIPKGMSIIRIQENGFALLKTIIVH